MKELAPSLQREIGVASLVLLCAASPATTGCEILFPYDHNALGADAPRPGSSSDGKSLDATRPAEDVDGGSGFQVVDGPRPPVDGWGADAPRPLADQAVQRADSKTLDSSPVIDTGVISTCTGSCSDVTVCCCCAKCAPCPLRICGAFPCPT